MSTWACPVFAGQACCCFERVEKPDLQSRGGDTVESVIDRACSSLRKRGWTVTERSVPLCRLPQVILDRYPCVPEEWAAFLSQVSRCVKDGETAWLLCLEDFEEADGGGFRWNEFEQLSLQAAADAGDTVWQADIRRFWDAHIPVGLSVGGAYEYYAIRVSDGVVVHGAEPEFEEVEEAAASFFQLLTELGAGNVRL